MGNPEKICVSSGVPTLESITSWSRNWESVVIGGETRYQDVVL